VSGQVKSKKLKNIEANLRQMLADRELPAPVEPQDGILW